MNVNQYLREAGCFRSKDKNTIIQMAEFAKMHLRTVYTSNPDTLYWANSFAEQVI